jgi:hypothetical protein
MFTPDGYIPRIVDYQIDDLMKIYGAVCVEGPKWCGKTWTSRNHAASVSFISDPANNFMNKQLAETDPSLVLEGKLPRLIDEWQEVPSIWDAVKFRVDQTKDKGLYILTGSSTPVRKGELHGGSGRIGKVRMRTMSLYESGHSSGNTSIMDLFDDKLKAISLRDIRLTELVDYVVRGGWPGSQILSPNQSQRIIKDYLLNIPDDMERTDGKKRDIKKVTALLRALGRAESNMTSKSNLKRVMEEYSEDNLNASPASIDTISDYLDCFNRLFLLEDQPYFENKLRSSVKALKNPKRHFADPSLAVAAIDASHEMLMQDLNTFGYLFEALCIRDLRIYADYHGASVYHYSDEDNNEADAIIQLNDGRWGMFEIKVGFNQVDAAANGLISLKEKFYRETKSEPAFLCVICGMSMAAYKRPDGVFVVPVTALKF